MLENIHRKWKNYCRKVAWKGGVEKSVQKLMLMMKVKTLDEEAMQMIKDNCKS